MDIKQTNLQQQNSNNKSPNLQTNEEKENSNDSNANQRNKYVLNYLNSLN
jgi:hypothetical protein